MSKTESKTSTTSGSGYEEILLVAPTTRDDLALMPLVADIQFGETHSSEALNRKNAGIVRPGVFRGYECSPNGGMDLLISSASIAPLTGVTHVEFDWYSITIHQNLDVVLTTTVGDWYVVLEANYEWKVVTKQVDSDSDIAAAEIKIIAKDDIKENQVILCSLSIPGGTTILLEEHLDFLERPAGGHDVEGHVNHPTPHPQYDERLEILESFELPEASTSQKGIVQLSNSFSEEGENKATTEKALKDGLETRYGEDNPSPLLLKFKTVSYLNISLLPVNSTPVEWVVPSGGENMKFAEVELMVITSELINCFLYIYFHEDDSGSDTSSAYSKCCFSIPPFNGSHNVRLSFTIPTSLYDGQSPKRLTFNTYAYTPSGTDPNAVISNFQLLIDRIRVVDHEQ